jgi:hypothetical protein
MNWIVLKSLNEIYTEGKTSKKESLLKDPFVLHLLKNTKELRAYKNHILKGSGFEKLYEHKYLNEFNTFNTFLMENTLLKSQTRFEEKDIRILMSIRQQMDSGELYAVREQIIANQESVRGVSLMFFKNEKYLEEKISLVNAIKQLLKIEELSNDKDQQYLYVLQCNKPNKIVLCENLDFLKRPAAPRANNVELWYAGGKNIAKLDYVNTRDLQIYYSCDWDYDGLKIFEAVLEKIPEIKLLYPNGEHRSIEITEHKSFWQNNTFSGLNEMAYNKDQRNLINKLIDKNQWIIEESNNLIDMLSTHS